MPYISREILHSIYLSKRASINDVSNLWPFPFLKVRSRECNNPPPFNGGASCQGEFVQYAYCNEQIPCQGKTSTVSADAATRLDFFNFLKARVKTYQGQPSCHNWEIGFVAWENLGKIWETQDETGPNCKNGKFLEKSWYSFKQELNWIECVY